MKFKEYYDKKTMSDKKRDMPYSEFLPVKVR